MPSLFGLVLVLGALFPALTCPGLVLVSMADYFFLRLPSFNLSQGWAAKPRVPLSSRLTDPQTGVSP